MAVNVAAANREAARAAVPRPARVDGRPPRARSARAHGPARSCTPGRPSTWDRMCWPMRGAVKAADPVRGLGARPPRTPSALAASRRDRLRALPFARRRRADGGHHLAGHAAARRGGRRRTGPRRPRSSPTGRGGTSSASARTDRRRWTGSPGSATSWRLPSRRCSSARARSTSRASWRRRSPWATRCTCATRRPPGCSRAGSPRRWRRRWPTSSDLEAILRFVTRDNDQFFLAWSMCAAKAAARSIDGLEGSTSSPRWRATAWSSASAWPGLGDRWFTGPGQRRRGPLLPRLQRGRRQPRHRRLRDHGDLRARRHGDGGVAGGAEDRRRQVVRRRRGDHARDGGDLRRRATRCSRSPPLDGEGTPTGIDIRQVVQTRHRAAINTAIAHRARAAHDRRRYRDAARSSRSWTALRGVRRAVRGLTPADPRVHARCSR